MDKKLFMVPAFFLVEADSEENAINAAGHAMIAMHGNEDKATLVLDEELRVALLNPNVRHDWFRSMKGYIPEIPS